MLPYVGAADGRVPPNIHQAHSQKLCFLIMKQQTAMHIFMTQKTNYCYYYYST